MRLSISSILVLVKSILVLVESIPVLIDLSSPSMLLRRGSNILSTTPAASLTFVAIWAVYYSGAGIKEPTRARKILDLELLLGDDRNRPEKPKEARGRVRLYSRPSWSWWVKPLSVLNPRHSNPKSSFQNLCCIDQDEGVGRRQPSVGAIATNVQSMFLETSPRFPRMTR
jgi:hypothetical protein